MITDYEFVDAWANAVQGLRSYAWALSRDPLLVDDLVQQTALQAWAARHHLRPDSNVTGWLSAILRNCYYAWRSRPNREVEDPDGRLSEALATDPEYFAQRELDDVGIALQELSETQCQALSHVVLKGLSYAEAARISGCKEGTIKSRIARAREILMEVADRACSGRRSRRGRRLEH